MRVPLSWLNDFTPIPADPEDEVAVSDVASVLDSLGLVVERTERVGIGLERVVLAKVLEVNAIPGADRVRQVFVDAGDDESLEIVCGATNFGVGDIVPLARVGTVLGNGMTIARRKMRGVTSNGMLCSGAELGVNENEMGLLILGSIDQNGATPLGIELGSPVGEHLGIVPDVVYDIAVEPNRPDCLSIIGIARDLAAALRLPFSVPDPAVTEDEVRAGSLASVGIDEDDACERLVARVLTDLVVVSSPSTVARRLVLGGMRSINSIVDASNYVMLERGQPNHPYDLDRLEAPGLSVRFAKSGESLVTLDGEDHVLGVSESGGAAHPVRDAVITDANGSILGLAGIMGGASAEIGETTSRVVVEVAQFDPLLLGETSSRQGLRTEAFVRFWRGVDPEGLKTAADRFCELVTDAQLGAGIDRPRVLAGHLVAGRDHPRRTRIDLSIEKVNELLGTTLDTNDVESLLSPIGFLTKCAGEDLVVEVPSFRPDATRPVDLIEEVARHYGYERIEKTSRRSPKIGALTPAQKERRHLRRVLLGVGADEISTSSIVDPRIEDAIGTDKSAVRLMNPISSSESALRRHILPGLVLTLRHNEGRRNGSIRLFEIGRVFENNTDGGRPIEREVLGVLFAKETDDASTAMRVLSRLGESLRVTDGALVLDQDLGEVGDLAGLERGFHPTRSGRIVAHLPDGPILCGAVGEIDPNLIDELGLLKRRIGALVIDLDVLDVLPRRTGSVEPVSRFPSSDVDLAFTLAESVPASALGAVLRKSGGELVESVELLDVYRGERLPTGSRSLTYRVRACAGDRTLSDADLSELRSRLIDAVEAALPASLRG